MNYPFEKIRLVIADDHPTVCKGLVYAFSTETDFHLIASVSNGKDLLSAVKEHQPHVVITDIKMNDGDGCEACLRISQSFPETGVIVFSSYDNEELILQLRKNGAKGYLLKGVDTTEVVKAVRAVYNGGEYYCKAVRERINHLFQTGKLGHGTSEQKETFTETELRIIRLICKEHSTKEIADQLKIKERTIQSHKEHIEEKMNVRGVVGIAVYALSNWLIY